MTTSTTEVSTFFDNTGGTGAPSAKLSEPGDWVHGEIVDQYIVNAKKYGTDVDEIDERTGKPVQQLVVILQTDLRNWDGLKKIPLIDAKDESKGTRPPSDDDGKRAIYVKPGYNLHGAIGKAIAAANGKPGPLVTGGTLGVKVDRLEPSGKGNPKKVHEAKYEAPSASAAVFGGGQPSTPVGQQPAASQPAQAAQGVDPWSGQAQGSTPPF